jgi:hypothetical protein
MLEHPTKENFQFANGSRGISNLTEVSVIMHSPALQDATLEKIREVFMSVSGFIQDV